MRQSMPNAARPAGRLLASHSSADSLLPRFSLACRSFLARFLLASRSLLARFSLVFRQLSPIARASIFESNALTTSTFDSNTYPPLTPEAHRTHLKTK